MNFPLSRRPFLALLPPLALLAASTALFELTDLDLRLQDRCYDFATGAWRIDAAAPLGRWLCYDGPKALLIALAVGLLSVLLGPVRWRDRLGWTRRGIGIALLTLVTVPVLVGAGKRVSNVFCPSEIRRYGGDMPYAKTFASYSADDRPTRQGHGFPAGHASGGYALFGLVWLRESVRWRRGVILLALAAGGWMGGYQMLKGAHYLSHTITTLLLAWLIAAAFAEGLRAAPAEPKSR